jgi:hypothetical protein
MITCSLRGARSLGVDAMWVAALFMVNLAVAQEPAKSAPAAVCPPSGFARPIYGTFGDNDGNANAYEIAGPCISPEVREAAEAIGLGRYRPLGVKNVTTIRFQATGSVADDHGKLEKADVIDVSISYVVPAIRLVTQQTVRGATVTNVRVFTDGVAFNETTPGVDGKLAPSMIATRAPLIKLTPYGALWSVTEAEGTAKISHAGAATTMTGASPYDGYEVSTVLDAKHLPQHVTVKANGKVYDATFSDYSDKWESPYLNIFPSHMIWKVDGKLLADLTVTAFHSNPYVVFPLPAAQRPRVAAAAH